MEHMHKGFKMLLQFVNNRKKWQKVMFFLSCVVVFVTTYALILPAITLEQQSAKNEAGIILGTDDVFLPDGYDTPAPDNVRYSDAGIIDGQDTDVPEQTTLMNSLQMVRTIPRKVARMMQSMTALRIWSQATLFQKLSIIVQRTALLSSMNMTHRTETHSEFPSPMGKTQRSRREQNL